MREKAQRSKESGERPENRRYFCFLSYCTASWSEGTNYTTFRFLGSLLKWTERQTERYFCGWTGRDLIERKRRREKSL